MSFKFKLLKEVVSNIQNFIQTAINKDLVGIPSRPDQEKQQSSHAKLPDCIWPKSNSAQKEDHLTHDKAVVLWTADKPNISPQGTKKEEMKSDNGQENLSITLLVLEM